LKRRPTVTSWIRQAPRLVAVPNEGVGRERMVLKIMEAARENAPRHMAVY
jgi:hypothetical protein